MAGNLVISQINGGPIGVINAIINGNYQINQRGVSGTVTLTAGNYGHDRWKAGASGCTYTFATVNNVTILTITAGTLVQVIEGSNLYSGTYALSFTGTAQGKIGAGSFAGSGVTGTAVGGTNLNIEFNTGTVSLVQFEPGVEVSPFERRDIGRELMMCQRYFEVWSNIGGNTGYMNIASGGMSTTTQATFFYNFLVQKRANPSFTFSSLADFAVLYNGGAAASTISTFTLFGSTPTTIEFQATTNTVITAFQYIQFAANNNATTSKLFFSAEL